MTMTEELQEQEVKSIRDCTRCAGSQHLIAHKDHFGLYACDDCALRVGFDLLSTEHREFLLHRGNPARYTKDFWGSFKGEEQRL